MGESRRLSLKGNANKAMESFTINIKPLIHKTCILMLRLERGRGLVRDRKESGNPNGRGK